MTPPVLEFLRRVLQHVLPRGLHKVRHYGFLSRRSRIDLEDVRAAIVDAQCVAVGDLELQQLPAPWESLAPWPSPVLSRPAAEARGNSQKGDVAHVSALVRNSAAGSRDGYPYRAELAGTQ